MQIVITGGPASEPIDQVRFITNQSTGELAVKLAQRFLAAGHDVELFLGRGASWHLETARYFQTNEESRPIAKRGCRARPCRRRVARSGPLRFRSGESDRFGQTVGRRQDFERRGTVELRLVPKPKLIRRLRELFAGAFIVGWKFELEGTPADVVQEGHSTDRVQPDECMHCERGRFWVRIRLLHPPRPCPHAAHQGCPFGMASGGRYQECRIGFW